MISCRRPLVGLVLVLLSCTRASAQETPWEIGLDGAMEITSHSNGDDAWGFVFPVPALRIGIGLAPFTSFELAGSVSYSSVEGETRTNGSFFSMLSVSRHRDYHRRSGPFIGAGIGADRVQTSVDGDHQSDTRLGFGGRAGYRFILSETFAMRLAAGYTHWRWADPPDLDNPNPDEDERIDWSRVLTLGVGLSVFP